MYMKASRLIVKTMKSGHADPNHIDPAIENAAKLMIDRMSGWKKTRDENLEKNPYVPPTASGNGHVIADSMANLFVSTPPTKGAPATPKEEKKKKAKKEVEESDEDEEEYAEDEEEAVDDDEEDA